MRESEKLTTKVGTKVRVSLESNPTTGYQWEPIYDKDTLAVSSEYQRESEAVGGGGKQIFNIVPLRKGKSLLKIRYKRPWETQALKEQEITISATD